MVLTGTTAHICSRVRNRDRQRSTLELGEPVPTRSSDCLNLPIQVYPFRYPNYSTKRAV